MFAGTLLDPLLAQLLCLTRGGWLRGCCQSCRTRVDLAGLERQREFVCLFHCCFLSVRDAHTEARGQRPTFRAHSNLWWTRHGWYRIHLVSRPENYFSRPPYFTAGVNLTAEFPSEPPRGGEYGAGAKWLNRNSPFAESRNCLDNGMRLALTT